MKKLIVFTLAILFVFSLAACGISEEAGPTTISPNDYDAINAKHMSSLLVGMIISMPWQNANELEPSYFIYYYAASLHQAGTQIPMDDEGFIPAEELEPYIQKLFGVTTEHLRSGEYYSAEKNAYEFGGLGSAVSCKITGAELKDNQLAIGYDIIGPMDYKLADGKLQVEFDGKDYLYSDNYKYLSNQFEWSAQYYLCFPSAMNETDNYSVFMMNSGGSTSTSIDGANWKHYNGEDITSIIDYYENEALPALEAVGEADTTKYADGWYWSGTYRGDKPLTIDVQRKYGADSYIITALYDEKSDPDIANNIRSREFMQPPDLSYFPELNVAYLWRLCKAGVLDTSWNSTESVDVGGLVRLYAIDAALADESVKDGAAFPAADVENFIQKRFDIGADTMRGWNVYDSDKNVYNYTPVDNPAVCSIVRATTYGSEDGSPATIVLAYDVIRSEEDDTVIWSGELTVELSSSGYKYLSNNKYYPIYSITQDTAYLDELTEKYLNPLMPAYGIAWRSWQTAQDISADLLTDFCSYNNLLNRELGIEGEYLNNHAPAVEMEAAIQQYFDVPTEYLRTSGAYNYFSAETGERYDNEYCMFYGYGGGGTTRALNAEQDGNLLKITVGLYGPDDEIPSRPAKTGLLTIRLDGDRFQYLSYALDE